MYGVGGAYVLTPSHNVFGALGAVCFVVFSEEAMDFTGISGSVRITTLWATIVVTWNPVFPEVVLEEQNHLVVES